MTLEHRDTCHPSAHAFSTTNPSSHKPFRLQINKCFMLWGLEIFGLRSPMASPPLLFCSRMSFMPPIWELQWFPLIASPRLATQSPSEQAFARSEDPAAQSLDTSLQLPTDSTRCSTHMQPPWHWSVSVYRCCTASLCTLPPTPSVCLSKEAQWKVWNSSIATLHSSATHVSMRSSCGRSSRRSVKAPRSLDSTTCTKLN